MFEEIIKTLGPLEAAKEVRRVSKRLSLKESQVFILELDMLESVLNENHRELLYELARIFRHPQLYSWYRELGLAPYKQCYKVVSPESLSNEQISYIVGYFIGDGCMHKARSANGGQMDISSKDEQIINAISDLLQLGRRLENIKEGFSSVFRVVWTSKLWYDLFLRFGIIPGKSKIDVEYSLNGLLYGSVLRGLLDSDGSVSVYKNKGKDCCTVSWLGGSKLMDWISSVLQNQGIKHTITHSRKLTMVSVSSRKGLVSLFEFIYKDCTVTLYRKYNKIKNYIGYGI